MILFLTVLCFIFIFHGVCSLFWLLYAWQDHKQVAKEKSPTTFDQPRLSFTALVPARHESKVINDTIRAIQAIEYPNELKEILIICRKDDLKTIESVERTIRLLQNPQIRLVRFADSPINKPHALNIGLKAAKNQVVVIFDAEDQPHPSLYNIANTLMLKHRFHVLQSGVQLMNYRSHWFSTLNVLEYFFWFKSTLHYFAKERVVPLGGNTVFFEKNSLLSVGGWDENCLTEDADIGIRLSVAGANIGVTYAEEFVTQEETPGSVKDFIKQRTRWNQGFLEILAKGDWLKLPGLFRKLLAFYIFLTPFIQVIFFVFAFVQILFTRTLPIWLVLLLTLPQYLLAMQLLSLNIGLFLFCRAYKLPYYIWLPLKVCITFFLYQLLLGWSAFRAIGRAILGQKNWEKTPHSNAHRPTAKVAPNVLLQTELAEIVA